MPQLLSIKCAGDLAKVYNPLDKHRDIAVGTENAKISLSIGVHKYE